MRNTRFSETESIYAVKQLEMGISIKEITYTYIGTNEDACQKNAQQLASMYKHNLKDWEYVINHYLRTGERIKHHCYANVCPPMRYGAWGTECRTRSLAVSW